MTPEINGLLTIVAGFAFALGWVIGGAREWKKAHRDACAVTDAHMERLAELRKERDLDLADVHRLLAAKVVVDKLLASRQRRLRGVLSEARRWKSVAEHLGWVRPTQANVAALGAAVRETMDRENSE